MALGYNDIMGQPPKRLSAIQAASAPSLLAPQTKPAPINTQAQDVAVRAGGLPQAQQGNSSLVDQIPSDEENASYVKAARAARNPVATPPATPQTALGQFRGASADRQVGDLARTITGSGLYGRTVQDTSVPDITRVNGGSSPLFTNVDPATAVDQMRGGTVNSMDFNAGNASLAKANAIRSGMGALQDQINFNAGQGASRQMSQDEIIRGMLASPSRTDRQLAMQYLTGANNEGLQQGGAMQRAQLNADVEREKIKAGSGLTQAQTELAKAQATAAQKSLLGQARPRPEYDKELLRYAGTMGDTAGAQAHISSVQALQKQYDEDLAPVSEALRRGYTPEQIIQHPELGPKFIRVYGAPKVQGYANGGEVAPYGQTPQVAQALPEINDYREYTLGAQRLGLPAVPFEQFLSLRGGAPSTPDASQAQPYSAMGFANGGEIPDMHSGMHDGKMVVDMNPNAPTDSIPAMIDGQHPAKLDSGEFVLPQDVVKFFGTDKLNKMIAQARAGQNPQE